MPISPLPPTDSQGEQPPIPAMPMHGFEVIVKGVITVAIASLGAIVADQYFARKWGEYPIHLMGVAIVALISLRAFTDGSYSSYKRQNASDGTRATVTLQEPTKTPLQPTQTAQTAPAPVEQVSPEDALPEPPPVAPRN